MINDVVARGEGKMKVAKGEEDGKDYLSTYSIYFILFI